MAHNAPMGYAMIFLVLSLLGFLVSTFGADVIARMTINGEDFWHAASEHLHYATVESVVWLMAPWLLLAWMGASTAKEKNFHAALGVFFLGTIGLGYLYFSGYQSSHIAMKNMHPTAAALSIGVMPLYALGLLILSWVLLYIFWGNDG
jgi:hypothetical protein